MNRLFAFFRDLYQKRKKLFIGVFSFCMVLLTTMAVMLVLPKVKAGNSLIDSAINISAGETSVTPGSYYKIQGNAIDTYTLIYSGNQGDEPAYIVLEDAQFNLSSDIPAIKLVGVEEDASKSNSYGNFVIYIKGTNRIISTCAGATQPLIQVENMSYDVKAYNRYSPYVNQEQRFDKYTVTRAVDVEFRGTGDTDDSLTLMTANGSTGAAIGSAEIKTMVGDIKFTAGNKSIGYVTINGVMYKHGQEVFTGNLQCGSGSIKISEGASIIIEGKGFGAGVGTGASLSEIIEFKGDGNLATTNIQTAQAKAVMNGNNIQVSGGALAVHMSQNSLGCCIGTGAVGTTRHNNGTVTITGGTLDLQPSAEGYEFASAVNANGTKLFKFVLDVRTAAGSDGIFKDGETFELQDTAGGEKTYIATYTGNDTDSRGWLTFTIPVENAGNYVFQGYAGTYFDYLNGESMCFYLPTQILKEYQFVTDGDLDSVSYSYKIEDGSYASLYAGAAINIKETKDVTIKLNNVPHFCTKVSYRTKTGESGVITKDVNDEYLFAFEMPSADYSVDFSYEIGKYNISYDYGTDKSNVSDTNPVNYPCGEGFTLKEPSWEGHQFAGWYSDAEYTQPITEIYAEETNASITVYAKWTCDVSFVDESGQVYFGKPVDYGTRFLETDYPEDPEDNSQKIFVGWIVNGTLYPKGNYTEFVVTENMTIQGSYQDVGYYVNINGTYTNQDGIFTVTDIKKMASFDMYFQGNPIAFTDTPSTEGMYYTTVDFADRSDVTTGKVTVKPGYKIASIEVKDEFGNHLQLFSSMDDDHAFTFTMPETNVYITVNFQMPDYTITYYDYNSETDSFVSVTPEETAACPNVYEFNANTPEIILNPAPKTDKYMEFAGWYVFGDPNKTLIRTIPTGTYDSNIILVAVWKDAVTYPVEIAEDIKDYVSVVDEDGNVVNKGVPGEKLSIVVKPGKGVRYERVTFSYTDEDGGTYTRPYKPSADTVYPCHYSFQMPEYKVNIDGEFSVIEYTITYLGLMGAENPNPDTYNINSVIELQDPVRKGYVFEGWTIVLPDDEMGYESVREEEITVIENRAGNIILVANWEEDENYSDIHRVTVSRDITNGNITLYAEEAVKEQYVFLEVKPERGYQLSKITYNTPDAQMYSAKRALRAIEELADITFEVPLVEVAEGVYYFVMPDQDVELVAEFTPIEYSIQYIDGQVDGNPKTYTVESVITLKSAEKAGYEFMGWYNDEGVQMTEISDHIGNLNLTAKWKESKPADTENTDTDAPSKDEPSKGDSQGNDLNGSQNKNDSILDNLFSQLQDLIRDKSKVDSSEDLASHNQSDQGKQQSIGEQLVTGDKANISHFILVCILSLIIMILACPKKKDDMS